VPLPAGMQVAIAMSLHKKQKEARFKKIVIITMNYAKPNSKLSINKLSINK